MSIKIEVARSSPTRHIDASSTDANLLTARIIHEIRIPMTEPVITPVRSSNVYQLYIMTIPAKTRSENPAKKRKKEMPTIMFLFLSTIGSSTLCEKTPSIFNVTI
ncbi:MAG: hypothetical protein BAJATHORv1_60070 [Candidatus Thorarchaeota archaeon]|nr:MAG: hypothetical protein BAJATHORv1_60070 [Candidatus Thorarchaeota archaeon]